MQTDATLESPSTSIGLAAVNVAGVLGGFSTSLSQAGIHVKRPENILLMYHSFYWKVSGESQVRGGCLSAGPLLLRPHPPQGVKIKLTRVTC